MKRPSYREAIRWLVANDDTEWLTAEFGSPSVATVLVADMFGKTDEQVTEDLKQARALLTKCGVKV